MTEKSFYGFPYSHKEEWIDLALKNAKLKTLDQLIFRDEIEEIEIPPFFTSEDVANWKWQEENDTGLLNGLNGRSLWGWDNIALIDLDEEKLEGIKGTLGLGIDGVILNWSGEGDLERLLDGVHPEYISIWLKPKGNIVQTLTSFLQWFKGKEINNNKLCGGLLIDPLADLLESNEQKELERVITKVNLLTKDFSGFCGHCIDFSVYLNSGGNSIQQLTYGLGAMIECLVILEKNKVELSNFWANFFVCIGSGGDYFYNIAKLKILRIMVSQVAALYGKEFSPGELKVFVVTGLWTKSHLDIETNMVRNTVEAMMAVQGGGNLLYVTPHDILTNPLNVRSKRIAANISNLLKMEGHFDKVMDLTEGAYYLYYLQDSFYDKVIIKLKKLESQGGWLQAFQNNAIQRDIGSVREKQLINMREGRFTMVGVNAYFSDTKKKVDGEEERIGQLLPVSKSLLFEKTNTAKP